MDSIGERLKHKRLEKGLSLKEVSKKTRIHLDILEALEEGRLINKAPIYIRGFIKIYCEFLGLNPEDFITGFKKSNTPEDHAQIYQKPILPKPSVRLSRFQSHFKIIRIAIAIVLLFLLGLGIIKLTQGYKSKKQAAALLEKKKGVKEVEKQIPSEIIRLGIRARQDCWIKTKVDGKVTFQDVLKKGQFESWQAENKIELSLGNAGGIDLQLNGKLISPLGRKGQVIRQIVITKEEGLKIVR